MKKLLFFLVILSLLLSCSLNKQSDEASIDDLIYSLKDFLLVTYDQQEETTYTKSYIEPLLWYRSPSTSDSLRYTVDINLLKDSAFATIKIILPGNMNIWYKDSINDTVNIVKEYVDTLLRYAFFKRDTVKDFHNGWRLVKITNTYLYTKNPPEVKIDSIKLYAQNIIDTIIRMDTIYYEKDKILSIPSGTYINITLFSTDSTSRFFVHTGLRRIELSSSSQNIFSVDLRSPLIQKRYRLVIDGFTQGSLNDDSLPYSSRGLVLPYIVE